MLKVLIFSLLYVLPALVLGESNQPPNIYISPPDSAEIIFNQEIFNTKDDSLKRIKACFKYGTYLDEKGDYENSIKQLKTALNIAEQTKSYSEIATIANYLGGIFAGIGNFKASNEIYLIALKNAEKINDYGDIAKISMNLASNYNHSGDYEKAIKYGLYALKTKETNHNMTRICYHYIEMGNIFRENNNIVKWEEYVQKAYKMKDVEDCSSFGDIAKIYNCLGGIAVQKNELNKGLLYYDTLLTFSREIGFEMGISTALTNSAGIYKQLNNYKKALELATEAENYINNNPYERIFSNNFKAEIYQLKGQYSKGLELVKANINIEELQNYSTEKLKCLQLLYELNFNLKNYDAAYFWNDSLQIAENRLRDENIRRSFENLEAKYETEKKEQKIELLSAENKLKTQRINVGIGIVVVLIILFIIYIYISNIHKKQEKLKQNILQQKVLRAQMNPHFIFNILGAIQNYMLHNNTQKASNLLTLFASLSRDTLNNSTAEAITLEDEIKMLRTYIELEQMRKSKAFKYEIYCNRDIETEFIKIPPMLIQPFIENSIKHGFSSTKKDGLLRVLFNMEDEKIKIEIIDNGIGIKKASQIKDKTHSSKAMKIFQERRKLFAKKTKQQIDFKITDRYEHNKNEHGTIVQIIIPTNIEY